MLKNLKLVGIFSLILLFFLLHLSQDASFGDKDANKNKSISWQLPQDINPKVLSTRHHKGITIQEINYFSSIYKGKQIKIFGYFCYPEKLKSSGMPGILLVHGGAGYADLQRAMNWANKGYAALSIDLPGKGKGRLISRSTGPNMNVPELFCVYPDLYNNYLYHAVTAARCGITFLKLHKFVNKTGIVGYSWGGVVTLIVNGIDNRIDAAVPVFGSGYLNEGSTWQTWFDFLLSKDSLASYINNFDARQFLKSQNAPIMYTTGTNDNCFTLPIFVKSYLGITQECTLALIPNMRHKVSDEMRDNIYNWVSAKLKSKREFPKIISLEAYELPQENSGNIVIKGTFSADSPVVSANIYCSRSGVSRWTQKKWKRLSANIYGNYFAVKLQKNKISNEILLYALVRDKHFAISTTPIYSIVKIKTENNRNPMYLLTEPIDKTFEHSFSRNAWARILGKEPEFIQAKMPLFYISTIGGSLKNTKDGFVVCMP